MEQFTGKVWVLGDDIDTDIIIPTEYLALKTIDDMKQYGFSPLRPELAGQIEKGDIIVAGKNFGCGSSREHAALVPLYLGVKAVIVKSFARIHCANLANAGILPLVFKDESVYGKIDQMDELEITNLREAIQKGGAITVKDVTKGFTFETEAVLTQRDIVLDGGLLNYTREHQA